MTTTPTPSAAAAVAGDPTGRAKDLVHRFLHDEALALISDAIEKSQGPAPVSMNVQRGRALLGLERHRMAEDVLRPLVDDARATGAERAEAMGLVGRILVRTWGDLDVAIDMLREAAKLGAKHGAPARDAVSLARGDAAVGLARKRGRSLAFAELAAARQVVGDDPRLVAFEASILLDFDDRVGARDLYLKLATMPGDGPRFHHLGLAHVALLAGEFSEGHRHLDAIGALARCDLAPRYTRARLLAAEDRWPEAAAAWAEVHAASPMGDNARWAKSEQASSLLAAGHREAGLTLYRALSAESADDRVSAGVRRIVKLLEDPAAPAKRRARLHEFPSVAQLRDHCGPASCELYLRFFGIPADQVEIARQIKIPGGGTPVYAMRKFLETAGFEVRRIEADLPTLRKVIDLGIPLILEEEYSTSRHVAVAMGYDDEREIVEVQDPMTHEVRETPYEALPRLLGMANHGAIIGVPKADTAKKAALDAAGVHEAKYIALVDEAWKAFDEKKPEDAKALCDQAMAIRRDYELLWICRFQLARHAHDHDRHPAKRQEMKQILDEMLRLWPDDEWPQQYVGYDLYYEGRYDEALRAFEKARDRDDHDGSNWAMIGDCLIAMNRKDAAVQPLVEALRRFPSHVRSNENLADLFENRGDLGRAWVLNDVAREINPQNPFNWEVQARLHERRDNPSGALAAFEQACKCAWPGRTWPFYQRARTLAKLGRVDDAVASLQPLIEQNPNDLGVRVELADLLYAHGRPERAMAVCQELLGRDQKLASAHAILGAALAHAGRLDEGIASMRQALTLRPAYSWVYSEMGKHLQKAGKTVDAVEAFAACVGLNQTANNRWFLGNALFAAGAVQDAAGQMRASANAGAIDEEKLVRAAEILTKAESYGSASDFLSGMATSRKGDPAPLKAAIRHLLETGWTPRAAEPLLDQLVEIEPEHPYALLQRGRKLLDRDHASEAEGEALLRSALELMPGSRAAKLALAEACVARGRHEEALAALVGQPPLLAVQKQRVKALCGLGRAEEAFKLSKDQEIESPNKAEAWELQYLVAQHVREYAPALDFAERLCQYGGSSDTDAHLDYWENEKFRCLLQTGDLERAAAFGEKQVGAAIDASYLSNAAIAEHQVDVARHFAQKALSMDAVEPLALITMARVTELAGDVSGARALLEKAAAADASGHSSRENLARLALSEGQADLAHPFAQEAVRLGHLCPWSFAIRGQVKAVRGDRSGALADLERSWLLADTHDREKGSEDVWAVRSALRGETAESARLRKAWTSSSVPKSAADSARLDRVMKALV